MSAESFTWLRRYGRGAAALRIRDFGARLFRCPLCGPSLVVRLAADEIAVRCARCGASAIAMSLASAVLRAVPSLAGACVYELSSRGPYFRFIERKAHRVVGSHYVQGADPGTVVGGVRVEDVQRLTFASESFDVCTSTEVFEHVADDRRAFAEVFRVLKPGGVVLFTVPMDMNGGTRERAMLVGSEIVHLEPAAYHRDPARGDEPVLCFRDYGCDIVERLGNAGFRRVEMVTAAVGRWFGYGRPVMFGQRPP